MEIHICLSCGNEFAVHCNYPISLPDDYPLHERFLGEHSVADAPSAIRNFLKLKKMLVGCERYQSSRLEQQFLDKKPVWDLGEFLDFEKDRLEAECARQSISINFTKIDPN